MEWTELQGWTKKFLLTVFGWRDARFRPHEARYFTGSTRYGVADYTVQEIVVRRETFGSKHIEMMPPEVRRSFVTTARRTLTPSFVECYRFEFEGPDYLIEMWVIPVWKEEEIETGSVFLPSLHRSLADITLSDPIIIGNAVSARSAMCVAILAHE